MTNTIASRAMTKKNGYVFLPDEHGLYATAENRRNGGGLPGAGAGSKWIDCFPYDYLMLRSIPAPDFYIHHGPQGSDAKFLHETGALAERVLQALRTESPREACLWAGSLLHWVSDASALAHAAEISVADGHTYLDRCLNEKQLIGLITINGYKPLLLGADDAQAIAGIRQRTKALLAFTKERGDKTKPIFQAAKARLTGNGSEPPLPAGFFRLPQTPKEEIERLAMEAAQEGARACADVLHTVLTLGLAQPHGKGATLTGKISLTTMPTYRNGSALVALVNASLAPGEINHQSTYHAATPYATHTGLDGTFVFRNLPPGEYRLLRYRVGSLPALSETFSLESGGAYRQDAALAPDRAQGNLVWNPSFALGLIHEGMPDRWLRLQDIDGQICTVSTPVTLDPGVSFRFGVERKDPKAKATLIIFDPADKGRVWKGFIRAETISDTIGRRFDVGQSDVVIPALEKGGYGIVQILTDKPVAEAIRHVRLAPETTGRAPH